MDMAVVHFNWESVVFRVAGSQLYAQLSSFLSFKVFSSECCCR